MYNVRPTQGTIKYPLPSRDIKIRVVDTPDKIFVCPVSMRNILNKGLPTYDVRSCWSKADVLKIKYGSKHRYPMFIWFDEWWDDSHKRFADVLFESACNDIDTSNDETPVSIPLDDKYMSYAITSHDPNIVKVVERNDTDPDIYSSYGNFNYDPDGKGPIVSKPIKKIDFNKLGYGRYFVLKPISTGRTKISITNIMSGKTDIRIVEVVN